MSKRTTSPNSFKPTRWASVPPICPAPTSAIFFRAMGSILAGRAAPHRAGCACLSAPGTTLQAKQPFSRDGSPPKLSRLDKTFGVGQDRLGRLARRFQILPRTHLDQPRDGSVEGEGLMAGFGVVEAVRLGVGGHHQLDVTLIEHVHERDEAPRLV